MSIKTSPPPLRRYLNLPDQGSVGQLRPRYNSAIQWRARADPDAGATRARLAIEPMRWPELANHPAAPVSHSLRARSRFAVGRSGWRPPPARRPCIRIPLAGKNKTSKAADRVHPPHPSTPEALELLLARQHR